ncbi:Sulfurtransferase TusE [Candidatus Hamiltonella defensa (Bemisia tabaci)]|nr:Sulfurtransferase TusE [Candidatus Hamiltonella defensa (Bemisia tabaci)]
MEHNNILIFEHRRIETDSQGYLKNTDHWSEALALFLAEQEGIVLTPEHWEMLYFIRHFYKKFNTSPAIRLLVKALHEKYGPEKGNSRYLYQLFPKGPATQASKIGGLPKPVKCI